MKKTLAGVPTAVLATDSNASKNVHFFELFSFKNLSSLYPDDQNCPIVAQQGDKDAGVNA